MRRRAGGWPVAKSFLNIYMYLQLKTINILLPLTDPVAEVQRLWVCLCLEFYNAFHDYGACSSGLFTPKVVDLR